MLRRIVGKIVTVRERLCLLQREFYTLMSLEEIPVRNEGGIVFRGCKRFELIRLRSLYLRLNVNGALSVFRTVCYFVSGYKFIVVAQDSSSGRLVGMDVYYFNHRDLVENTVHEGFVGVEPAYEGRGIATIMRFLAKKHFKIGGISGISTRISPDNKASLGSACKAGFEIIDQPKDKADNGASYYMVCNLESGN